MLAASPYGADMLQTSAALLPRSPKTTKPASEIRANVPIPYQGFLPSPGCCSSDTHGSLTFSITSLVHDRTSFSSVAADGLIPPAFILKLRQDLLPHSCSYGRKVFFKTWAAVSPIRRITMPLPLTPLVFIIRSRPCGRRSGEIVPHSRRMHFIHSPRLSLLNHLFRLQVRVQAAFQALNLSHKATIALPYHELSLLFPLSIKSGFLLRSHELALRASMTGSRVSQLSPLLL